MYTNLEQVNIDTFSKEFYQVALSHCVESLPIDTSEEGTLTGIAKGVIKHHFDKNRMPDSLNPKLANLIVKKGPMFIPSILKTKA